MSVWQALHINSGQPTLCSRDKTEKEGKHKCLGAPSSPSLSETQPRDPTTRLSWSPASSVIAAQSLTTVWYPANCPQLRGPPWICELGDFRRHLTLASAPPLSEVWSPLSCDKDLLLGFAWPVVSSLRQHSRITQLLWN